MSAYRISTHRMYRKWLLLIVSHPAVQEELNAEARCNPYPATMLIGDRISVLKTAHEEVCEDLAQNNWNREAK